MKILVRSPNWIGDAVLSTAALTYLKEKMPETHITILAKEWVKEIFLNHLAVDEIISLKGSFFSLIKKIRAKEYDMGILFTNSFSSAFLFFLAEIKERIGYDTDMRGFLLTRKVNLPKNIESTHQKDYYLALVREIVPGEENPAVSIFLSPDEEKKAKVMLRAKRINEESKVVGLNPGASYGPARRWAVERFHSLAKRIVKEYGAKILIFGGKKERELGSIIGRGIEKYTLNLAGETTLRELIALVKQCTLFITNDTGPMHIAAALDVPVVAIFGPTNPARTSPLGKSTVIKKEVTCWPCKYRICPLNHECMERITVDEVFGALEKYL